MNNLTNYAIALNNNLKEVDAIIADIDRQIAVHRKSMSEHEQSVDFLLKAKAIIRDHATSIQVELVK